MDVTVCITENDIVKEEPIKLYSPKNPNPQEKIFLSNIDQAVAFPVETIFFFETSMSTVDICDRVKRAIAESLLVPYYFMAGRLNFNKQINRLEILCNNGGILFVSATSRLCLEDLGNLSLPNSTFHHFIHRPGLYKSLADTALFTVQVTRFACGGFSIGFVTNHGIVDGKAASELFMSLASICRGEGNIKAKSIYNDRTSLKARNPPIIKYPHKEYIKLNEIPFVEAASLFTAPDNNNNNNNKLSPSPLIFSKKYIHKLFSFTPQMIRTLKRKANNNNNNNDQKCSSFEAIVAHLWRARTKAVFGSNLMEENSTVLFAVDIRSKITPPLPLGFAGNAVITAYATAKVGDLVEKPLSFSVEKMKKGRERVTNEYVRSAIDWLEVYKGIPNTCNGNFYVSAWWKLPFNELDFGFGKPSHGGPVVSGNDEFVLLLSDGKKTMENYEDGGINVWIGLAKEKMDKFILHFLDI